MPTHEMDSQKYLIIITLIDGQNFSVPDGVPERVDATVFAEARFGNESILKSDPIKLINSNPEFVTELAWQLDKRSLHQIRVERRAIKLQVFLQTREKRRHNRPVEQSTNNHIQASDSGAPHKVELIGYTILDIRSAQERMQPKFQWLPLLNPKFRKSSYNRPEIQLAVSLNRVDDTPTKVVRPAVTSKANHINVKDEPDSAHDSQSTTNESCSDSQNDSRLYKTCLDISIDPESAEHDEIVDNDIRIISKNGNIYIYDTRDIAKPTIDDCDEKYQITITIPFNSDLDTLIEGDKRRNYYFSVNLFGSSLESHPFHDLTSVETKEMQFTILTTHAAILATYFELNSSLEIRLHDDSGEPLGIATVQLDQLASIGTKKRSIEGIFALQSMTDYQDTEQTIHPSIGVSIVLERVTQTEKPNNQADKPVIGDELGLAKAHFGEDIDDYLYKSFNDTHQLTFGDSNVEIKSEHSKSDSWAQSPATIETDHHFCFTIDLKNFFYTQNQRLIPTLRELVVRYTYPFFGYKDTITTDTSIPISPTNSIIVSGYCEFNFATSTDALITALSEMPLDLEILASDQVKRVRDEAENFEHIVATCNLNLAETLDLNKFNVSQSLSHELEITITPPIYGLDGQEVGKLQIYLSLKDLGKPTYNFKASIENLVGVGGGEEIKNPAMMNDALPKIDLDNLIDQAKTNFLSMKEDCLEQLTQEMKKRESERFRRLCQRFETKEAKREQEFKKKMEDLSELERRFKNSLTHIESLEKRLANNFDQLKTKDALLDNRLDTFDLKISKAIGDIKLEYEKRFESLTTNKNPPVDISDEPPRSRFTSRAINDINQPRRSSMKCPGTSAGIPVSIRSSSLARAPSDSTQTRLVKRPTGVVTTVVNGISSRPRSNSTRLNLSKETQEKLASLRREKAELLKRGCRPNDELIQEINSMIEKLAC